MTKKSVTLVEVIVGAGIIALVFGSLIASFMAVRRYVNRANTRLVASNLARSVLDDLYIEVRADTWDTAGLSTGAHALTDVHIVSGGGHRVYTRNYDVDIIDTDGDGSADFDYRQVTVNIGYPPE